MHDDRRTPKRDALAAPIRSLRARLLSTTCTTRPSRPIASTCARTRRGLSTRRRGPGATRLDEWIDEQVRARRPREASARADARTDFRREAEKQAAYTLLNRLVILRLMEAPGPTASRCAPAVVTGGWESRGYKDFRAARAGARPRRRDRGLRVPAAARLRGSRDRAARPLRARGRRRPDSRSRPRRCATSSRRSTSRRSRAAGPTT